MPVSLTICESSYNLHKDSVFRGCSSRRGGGRASCASGVLGPHRQSSSCVRNA